MGDPGLHVRGRAGPAPVRDGAQQSGLAQYSTGLAPLTPLCQGMSWAGTSVVRPCWDPTGLGYAGWEGCEEGVSRDQCGLEGTGDGGPAEDAQWWAGMEKKGRQRRLEAELGPWALWRAKQDTQPE